MNAKATAKYIRISPRKTRLVVDLVRGMGITEARHQLQFSQKSAAKPILKVLNSAVANAENNLNLDTSDFVITTAYVNEGPTFHRYRPRAHGRSMAVRKRMSHITIEVGPRDAAEKEGEKKEEPAKKAKAAKKKTTKKASSKKASEKKAASDADKKKSAKKSKKN